MAPIKFEEKLKETLEKRTLKPSKDAWSRLEGQLDENSGSKSKRFWILGIAASLIGILLISTFLFKSEVGTIQENKVVDAKKETSLPVETETLLEVRETTLSSTKKKIIEEKSIQVASEKDMQLEANKEPLEIKERPNIDLALEMPNSNVVENSPQTYEDVKVNEIVIQVQEMVKKNQRVTEEEIDSLLKLARQDINDHKTHHDTTGTVNAMALLQDVEKDLDKSFRDKVFDALLSSVENVATAVVQRNK